MLKTLLTSADLMYYQTSVSCHSDPHLFCGINWPVIANKVIVHFTHFVPSSSTKSFNFTVKNGVGVFEQKNCLFLPTNVPSSLHKIFTQKCYHHHRVFPTERAKHIKSAEKWWFGNCENKTQFSLLTYRGGLWLCGWIVIGWISFAFGLCWVSTGGINFKWADAGWLGFRTTCLLIYRDDRSYVVELKEYKGTP